MSRDQFLRLSAGDRAFAHVGTSYRRVSVVAIDVGAGLVDLRAYKPYQGLRWRDGRKFTPRVTR